MSALVLWLVLTGQLPVQIVPLVPLVPLVPASAPAPAYTEGKATLYTSGLMERVAVKRGLDLGQASGFAAYPDCGMIGRYMRVSVLDPRTKRWSAWHIKRIADCSEPADYERHVAEHLVELSYADARKYGYAYDGTTRIRYYLSK